MQRRAAAVYAVFFLLVGAGAYGFMGLTEAPSVSLSGDPYTAGETLTVADRTYTVASVDGSGDGSGELTWTDPSAEFAETLENGTSVSPLVLTWDGQAGRWSSRLTAGDDVPYADGTYRVGVDPAADPPTATLEHVENASRNETVAVGGSLTYQGNETTVTAIDSDGVTLTWGEPYRVSVPNASAPESVTFIQQFDVSGRLADDPAVHDETVTVDGVESVVSRADNSTQPLDTYLPDPDTATFSEGDRLRYEDSQVTIGNVTTDGVRLTWSGERTNTIRFSEGANVTLNGQAYFTHFPETDSVQLLPREEAYGDYQQQLDEIDYYDERMLGLWGVVILSLIAAIMLLSTAYLPVKG